MQDILSNSTSTKDSNTVNVNGPAVVIFGAAAKEMTTPVKTAPTTALSKAHAVAASPIKTLASTEASATITGAVLERIHGATGGSLDISSIAGDAVKNAPWYDKLASSVQLTLSPLRDGFTDGLIQLGVQPNTARTFSNDGKFDTHEAVESMARIGNVTFAKIIPAQKTMESISALSTQIEKSEGMKLTDDTKLGLMRFEEGMLGVLDQRMKAPNTGLGVLFHDAIVNPGLAIEGIVDFVAQGAKVIAAPAVMTPAPSPIK